MDAGIKKIIELVKRTGDRFVVLDTESQEPFVVMSFDEYENLMAGEECWCDSCQEEGTEDLEEMKEDEEENADEAETDIDEPETEGELIEKINHDIAEWRERQQSMVMENLSAVEPVAAEETVESAIATPQTEPLATAETAQPILEKKSGETTDEKYYFEPVAG